MIKILYEDDALLVLDKPSGLIVNNSKTSGDNTVQNLLKALAEENAPTLSDEESPSTLSPSDPVVETGEDDTENEFESRSGIVHRLDKDTSGVLIVAKTPYAFDFIKNQFKERQVFKQYIALVFGKLKDASFEINAPIIRSTTNRTKFTVGVGGREAVTRVERLNSFSDAKFMYTYAKVLPKTGRTHQIRVHMQVFGNPIVGDPVYSTKKQYKDAFEAGFTRLMLHAHSIKFIHPTTNEEVTFVSDLPLEFNSCIL